MASELEQYISDNSLRLFGVSNKTIIDYVIASATSSKSPDALFSSLNSYGLPDTPDAHEFINEVYSRAPRKHKHKSKAASSSKQAEKETKNLLTQKFGLLLDED
ncbi:hypothetical protein PLEOSDRAFT_1026670, partial [Pleurotus ostreatus PC15]